MIAKRCRRCDDKLEPDKGDNSFYADPGTFKVRICRKCWRSANRTAEELMREKAARLYYQDIVYTVCNWLDNALNQKTVCGTPDDPTQGVQDGLRAVGELIVNMRDKKKKE